MKTKLFLALCVCACTMAFSQVANEVLGGTVIVNVDGVNVTYTAGGSLSSGDYNTLIGDGSGSTLNQGSDNTFVGTATGASQTNAGDCVFVGKDAGRSNTTAYDNTFIGADSGEKNTIGSDNTFVGEESGFNNIDGSNNVFIGEDSGYTNTEGNSNTFIGSRTGLRNTTGSGNTFIGAESGIQGAVDTALGNSGDYDLDTFSTNGSGYSNTTGQANSFVGAGSGHQTTTGLANTFLGYNTGSRNRTGDLNTFIGYGSGWNNDSSVITAAGNGNRNTYLGAVAGSRNVSGNDNVGMGHDANFTSITNASRNVFIGAEAKVRGNNNVVIGYAATSYTTSNRSNQIILGSGSTATQNNAIVIGTNVTATRANTITLGGNTSANRVSVGIGTTTANANASIDLGDTDKGLQLNRMTTTQRNSFAASAPDGGALSFSDIGLMVYDTTEKALYIWEGSEWGKVGKDEDTGPVASGVPELLNYQSILKDSSGDPLANQFISLRMNIVDVTSGNTTTYSEIHNLSTSATGGVNITIGGGIAITGTFSSIDWSHANNLSIELDTGSGYVVIGSSPFVSVPYAIRAKYAENLGDGTASKTAAGGKDDRIDALEKEVKELKDMVSKLLATKK